MLSLNKLQCLRYSVSSITQIGKNSNVISSTASTFGACQRQFHTADVEFAARKGTREKARKKKVKVEVKKLGFIPHNERGKNKLNLLQQDKHIDDSWKQVSTDNVWIGRYYRWRVYTVPEAIECHRQTHHPTIYNLPNAPLNVDIELNMQGEKKTRFVENFNRMALIPHKFDHGEERKILVLAKGEELLREASQAGAALVGGPDVIKNIQSGDVQINDFQYIVAHPNIMPDMVAVRGLMKRKFPNPKNGTLGVNVVDIVQQYLNGIQYSCVKDEYQKNYGIVRSCVGTLNMDPKHLEENLSALLQDLNKIRPKRAGKFITRVILKSPPSSETLKIDPFVYVSEENPKYSKQTDDLEDDAEDEAASRADDENELQAKN